MIADQPLETSQANRLLSLLPPASRERVLANCTLRELAHKAMMHQPYTEIKEVYFPLSGVISWLVTMKDGNMAEAVTIGREGMAGIGVALRGRNGSTAAIVQSPGTALAMSSETFLTMLEQDPAFNRAINYYANVLINVMAQGAACNRLHEVTERCAKWLLMMHDRADGDEFTLLQEFLADMLGVRRPSVSVCASILQRAGYIAYKRGKVRITDRAGLEKAACECYAVITDEYFKMMENLAASK